MHFVIEVPASGRRVRVGCLHLDGHSPRHPEPKKRRRRQPPRWPTTRRDQSFGDKQTSHRKPDLALKLWTRQHPFKCPDNMRPIMTGQCDGNDPYIAHHSLPPFSNLHAWAGLTDADLTQKLRELAVYALSPADRRAEIRELVRKLGRSGQIGDRKAAKASLLTSSPKPTTPSWSRRRRT